MLKYWAGVDKRWVGAAARGSLVNSRWVSSGYGRWHGRWVDGSSRWNFQWVCSVLHLEQDGSSLTRTVLGHRNKIPSLSFIPQLIFSVAICRNRLFL